MSDMNIMAELGVAVREFQLTTGEADYGLYTDGKVAGVIEATTPIVAKIKEVLSDLDAASVGVGASASESASSPSVGSARRPPMHGGRK